MQVFYAKIAGLPVNSSKFLVYFIGTCIWNVWTSPSSMLKEAVV